MIIRFKSWISKTQNYCALLLVALLGTIGLSQYRSYGISFDEPYMRFHGASAVKYVLTQVYPGFLTHFSHIPLFNEIPDLITSPDRTHGTIFEFFLLSLEVSLGLSQNTQALWEMRHLATFVYCSSSLIVLFYYLHARFRKIPLAFLGLVLVITTPRIFADFFYNNKDAVFLAAFLIATISVSNLIKKPSINAALVSGFLTAFAIDIRPMALFIFVLGMLFMSRSILVNRRDFKSLLSIATVYFSTTSCFVYIMWPYLWADPVSRILEVTLKLSRYKWNGFILTNGREMLSTDLPWTYPLLWIGVTLPIAYLLIIAAGTIFAIGKFSTGLRSISSWSKDFECDFFVFLCGVTPFVVFQLIGVTLYDGWRHLYFIYPILVINGVMLMAALWERFTKLKFLKIATLICVIVSISSTVNWMVQNRPLQNLYFNQFAGKDVKENWVMDYWGLSNKMALEYILARDNSKEIKFAAGSDMELWRSFKLLDSNNQARVKYVTDVNSADYIITNYRGSKVFDDSNFQSNFVIEHRIWVGNANVSTILRNAK